VSESTQVTPLGAGRFRLVEDGRQRIAYAVNDGRCTWVFIDGDVRVIEEAASTRQRGRSGAGDQAALAAPMPASVASVNVTAGQQVGRGDVLIMLEAMKMEFPIKAPRDGVVKSLACRAGDLVQPGVPLLELE
jgi:biotin carboxyl carrier protein